MLRQLVNEARFCLTITTTGPLLVKSGTPTLTGPDMTPILTFRNGTPQVFMPGPSLKGAFRSHIEKVIRTLRPADTVVADPFESKAGTPNRPQAVGAWLEARKKGKEEITNELAYRDSDPVARLFGSTFFSGRVSIGDAYLLDERIPLPTEPRDGVGIDRLTGGAVKGAKFDLEVVSAGTVFATDVLLRNFECWQLGALLLVVQDMRDELIRLGSGKSRGLGAVKGAIATLTIHHVGRTEGRGENEIWGLGRFLHRQNNPAYGTWADDTLTSTAAPETATMGIRAVQTWRDEGCATLTAQAVAEFVRRIDAFPAYQEARNGRIA